MGDERMKVLSMLASGTLTVEQANQLLSALGANDDAVRSDDVPVPSVPERRERASEQRFGEYTFEQVLQMGTLGVEPAYFKKVRAAGLTDLTFEQILHMGTLGVEPEFVVHARAAGMPDLTFEQVVNLGMMGIEPEFITRVREAGLTDLTFEQIVQMGTLGVEPELFIQLRDQAVGA